MSTDLTLYQVEENRVALLDTLEMIEDEQQRTEALRDLVLAQDQAVAKRDAVIRWRQQRLLMAEAARKEADRLKQFAGLLENQVEHLDEYLVRVIQQFVPEPKRGARKLEGNLGALSLRKNPDSVQVTDEAAIPAKFKTLVITVPAEKWEQFIFTMTNECSASEAVLIESIGIQKTDVKLDKTAIKQALKDGEEVPGADLSFETYSLQAK